MGKGTDEITDRVAEARRAVKRLNGIFWRKDITKWENSKFITLLLKSL